MNEPESSQDLISKLVYVLMPARRPPEHLRKWYDEAYSCWQEVWSDAFSELHPGQRLNSDAFTRQDEIGALFLGDECIGLTAFSYADFFRPPTLCDSYFNNWPREVIDKVIGHINQEDGLPGTVLVVNNLTVRKKYRRSAYGISMKDLLHGIFVSRWLGSQSGVMIATPRINRRINDICFKWGALPIAKEVPSGHGDYVDLVIFLKNRVDSEIKKNDLYFIVQRLWQGRLDTELNPETEEAYELKKAG